MSEQSGRFEGRVAVVAGAEHPLAASLCRRIASEGGRVVALGRKHDLLLDVARDRPDLIQTLTLGGMPHNVVDLLKGSWNGEPLDCFIDCMLLTVAGDAAASREMIALSWGLTDALEGGLKTAEGCGVLVVPENFTSSDSISGSISYDGLLNRFVNASGRGRRRAVRVLDAPETWTGADCLSAGDLVLSLFDGTEAENIDTRIVDWTPVPS